MSGDDAANTDHSTDRSRRATPLERLQFRPPRQRWGTPQYCPGALRHGAPSQRLPADGGGAVSRGRYFCGLVQVTCAAVCPEMSSGSWTASASASTVGKADGDGVPEADGEGDGDAVAVPLTVCESE